MIPEPLLFVLVLLFLFGLGLFAIWQSWRTQCPVPTPDGHTFCCRRRGHAGRHLTRKTVWVEFDEPRTPSGRICPYYGMSDADLDDYEACFDVPGRKK